MRAQVEQGLSVLTISLTAEDAKAILSDWNTAKEPTHQGKLLYSALMNVANPPANQPMEEING